MRPQKSNIVRQSNQLVEARYSLTLNEQRVILSLISMIHSKDKDFQYYDLDITQLTKLMGIDPKHATRDVENVIFSVQDRVIFIREADGQDYLRTHWLSAVKKVGNKIQLRFDPSLKPYLLQLKKQFTQFQLEIIVQFKSAYTIRIYALLKQYVSLKVRKFEVNELRKILGIEKEKYSEFKEFKRWVLNQAKKEFEEKDEKTGKYKSDITFELETEREGKFIKYLIFNIKQRCKEPQASLDLSKNVESSEKLPVLKKEPLLGNEQIDALRLLKENGVNETTASRLIKDFPLPRIIENINLARSKHTKGKAKDLGALTVSAIRDDWATATKSSQKQVEDDNKPKRESQAAHQEQEKKELEDLKSIFQKERHHQIDKLIESWDKVTLKAELSEFEKATNKVIRGRFEKYGLESQFAKTAFMEFVAKKYLSLSENDFVVWAGDRGYEIEGNVSAGYRRRSFKSIGSILDEVVSKMDR
ncbi:hypothetical protein PN36_12130 [Candidatus Thiomargarita nelsonii]|uniref:Initiator Rep protein WH1 domain-containing protein n=1 Tax=Candidatus Thiomargarita nelsonii TaxID=1003181 RepID=A0A4E0QPV4_9GAMM|nr:hypothetical protein PN36_12130 [Candidatus Thiomargarita nelsonii]